MLLRLIHFWVIVAVMRILPLFLVLAGVAGAQEYHKVTAFVQSATLLRMLPSTSPLPIRDRLMVCSTNESPVVARVTWTGADDRGYEMESFLSGPGKCDFKEINESSRPQAALRLTWSEVSLGPENVFVYGNQ